jgi:hypothetical protein
VYLEPYLDRFGIVVPFYGWFKVLFLAYLCLTRPSVSPFLHLRGTTNLTKASGHRAAQSSTNPFSLPVFRNTRAQSTSPHPSSFSSGNVSSSSG